jgi:O-methyltransferase involved in polyketide biosynthesis
MSFSSKLSGVPETTLWTLHNRAVESMRNDGILKDVKCEEIYNKIDFDYERQFGKADPSHAIRSLVFDRELRKYFSDHPDGTVVNLGEGLETQRYRLNLNSALWLSIDLPQAIELREKFIQPDDRHLHIPMSAIDREWISKVPEDKPVFITAQGLFMYLDEREVKSLIQIINSEFTCWYLMFDTVPTWLSKLTLSKNGWRKTRHYTVPKMPWGINRNVINTLIDKWLIGDIEVVDIGFEDYPRGYQKLLYKFLNSSPYLKNLLPTIIKMSRQTV